MLEASLTQSWQGFGDIGYDDPLAFIGTDEPSDTERLTGLLNSPIINGAFEQAMSETIGKTQHVRLFYCLKEWKLLEGSKTETSQ